MERNLFVEDSKNIYYLESSKQDKVHIIRSRGSTDNSLATISWNFHNNLGPIYSRVITETVM